MTQAKLEGLLKIDNESYNFLKVFHMMVELDNTQDVPLESMVVFMYIASFQNCNKQNNEEHFQMS